MLFLLNRPGRRLAPTWKASRYYLLSTSRLLVRRSSISGKLPWCGSARHGCACAPNGQRKAWTFSSYSSLCSDGQMVRCLNHCSPSSWFKTGIVFRTAVISRTQSNSWSITLRPYVCSENYRVQMAGWLISSIYSILSCMVPGAMQISPTQNTGAVLSVCWPRLETVVLKARILKIQIGG